MLATLHIRELDLMVSQDFDVLALHIEKLYTELFGAEAVPRPPDLERLRQQIASNPPRHWAFLAQDGGAQPCAFFTLGESFAVFAHGCYGVINELWVRPDVRGQGVGALVLDHCFAFGRRRGWRRIDVSAPASAEWDRSFEFYRRHGFTVTGRKLKYLLERG